MHFAQKDSANQPVCDTDRLLLLNAKWELLQISMLNYC